MGSDPTITVLFDGVCNFCISLVKFFRPLVRDGRVSFLPYQKARSIAGRYKLTESDMKGMMHLVSGELKIYRGAEAIAELLRLFAPFKPLAPVMRLRILQRAYKLAATHRYKIFGCSEKCYIP